MELNYNKAKSSLLAKKMAKPKVPGRHEKAEGTSLSVKSQTDKSESSDVELDDFAKEYVKKTGTSEESIKAALKGEPGAHLMGIRR